MLEHLGLVVHAVPRHAQRGREEGLEQPVVAQHLERQPAPLVRQLHALVGAVRGEPELVQLADHARGGGGRHAQALGQRVRAHGPVERGPGARRSPWRNPRSPLRNLSPLRHNENYGMPKGVFKTPTDARGGLRAAARSPPPGRVAPVNRVLMGLVFFPRGGSAHVARNLARNLPAAGWEATVVSGSLSIAGRPGDAREFYRGVDVRAHGHDRGAARRRTRCSPRCRCTRPSRTARGRPIASSPRSTTPSSNTRRARGRARSRTRARARRTCCTCTT